MFVKMLSKSVEKEVHVIAKGEVKKGESKGEFVLTVGKKSVIFTANSIPAEGDAVIKQSEKDLYHCPADVLSEKYYLNAEDVPSVDATPLVEELTARVLELEKEVEELEAANDTLDEKIEKLVTPPEDLSPVEYDEELTENMDIRQAQAAAREGLAFTCQEWSKRLTRYVTYDKKTEKYIWNRPDAKPGVMTLGADDYAREDYYLIEV